MTIAAVTMAAAQSVCVLGLHRRRNAPRLSEEHSLTRLATKIVDVG